MVKSPSVLFFTHTVYYVGGYAERRAVPLRQLRLVLSRQCWYDARMCRFHLRSWDIRKPSDGRGATHDIILMHERL